MLTGLGQLLEIWIEQSVVHDDWDRVGVMMLYWVDIEMTVGLVRPVICSW